MRLEAYLYTNPGGRRDNEDSADYWIEADHGIFVLADGLGGHRDGAAASALVIRSLLDSWSRKEPPDKDTDISAWLYESILTANDELLAAQKEHGSNMKSTIVALAIDWENCAWAHVGDSRLYYLTNGHIIHATQDHSVSFKKFLAGEIGLEDINFDDDRSSLLRVVGDPGRCQPDTGMPEINGQLCPGDAFLLCSDGFWQYLYDEEILIDFLKSETPEHWAELMLLRILPRITQETDNMTLLTVFVGGEDE